MRAAGFFVLLALLFPAGAIAHDMPAKPAPENVEDNREIVPLTENERAIVAEKMRQMLASIQEVTDGLAQSDMKAVGEGASKSGMAMMQDLPAGIRMKFPTPFMQMGMASHKAFDEIVQEANGAKNSGAILAKLSKAEQYCVACHAAYRFAPAR